MHPKAPIEALIIRMYTRTFFLFSFGIFPF
jgi:hypothetical protein